MITVEDELRHHVELSTLNDEEQLTLRRLIRRLTTQEAELLLALITAAVAAATEETL